MKRPEVHVRTRRDHATEIAEDYVEAIADIERRAGKCRGVDLAEWFGVTAVTVNRTIARLEKAGWVVTERYAPVTLTASGRKLALACRRRHELVVEFLTCIGVTEKTAGVDAEGIEHHVSPETLRCFERVIAERQCKADS